MFIIERKDLTQGYVYDNALLREAKLCFKVTQLRTKLLIAKWRSFVRRIRYA